MSNLTAKNDNKSGIKIPPNQRNVRSHWAKKKIRDNTCQSEIWDVNQQQAYAWMHEFIKFIISSTMSKVKLWTSWTYETQGMICIYDNIDQLENQSFDSLHAWLGKRIGLLIVKW